MITIALLVITVWMIVQFLDLLIFWLFLRKIKYADISFGFSFCGNFLEYFIFASAEEIIYRSYLLIFFYVNTAYSSYYYSVVAINILGILATILMSWNFAKIHFTLEAPSITFYYGVCKNFRKFFWDNCLDGKPISSFDKKELKSIYSQIRLKVKTDIEQNLFKAFFLSCFYFGIVTSMLVLFFGLTGFIAAIIAHTLVNFIGLETQFAPSDKKPFA